MGKVTFSINGHRRNQADTLRELRGTIALMESEVDSDTAYEAKYLFNELACQSNSFNCVHVVGFDGFDDLSSEPVVKLFDI